MKHLLITIATTLLLTACTESCPGPDPGPGPSPTPSPTPNGVAELPRVYLDTTMPTLTGQVIKVLAGGDLQKALNEVKPGETLELEAGATFTGTFTIPAKAGNDWIVVRTSNLAGLPAPGTRVTPAHSAAMPKIVSSSTTPAIMTADGAHHFRFIGVEFSFDPKLSLNYGIVHLGNSTTSSPAAQASNIVLDRCYIHGQPTSHGKRGVQLDGSSISVIDSYISEIHGWGQDTQAIGGFNGAGPFKIVNNYLEAAGENVLFGGADPGIQNLVSSDIEFRRNHLFKPVSWKQPVPGHETKGPWLVKNLFELKNAQRVLVEGNLMENNWTHGQTGIAIVFTVRNQDGKCPWCVVQDVTFENNIVRHVGGGISFLGTDYNHPSKDTDRILIRNNLFDDVDGKVWGPAHGLFIQASVDRLGKVVVDHNTASTTGSILAMGDYNSDGTIDQGKGWVITNNIFPHNNYGIFGDNYGIGQKAFDYIPGTVVERNVMVRTKPGIPSLKQYNESTLFPDTAGKAFIMVDSWDQVKLTPDKKALATDSPFLGLGADGKNIGAEIK